MASINKAENSLGDKLVNTIAAHDRDIREIKSALQPMGGDSLKVIGAPALGVLLGGPTTIAAGSSATYVVTVVPFNSILTLWNFAFTIYVDGLSTGNAWPGGSSLTTAQRECFVFNWLDWNDSSDSTNGRVYKIRVRNSDPGGFSHDYYLRFRAYLPVLGVTTS